MCLISDEFGRFLSSDGSIVFSEKDEFVYDEMIVHVPMAVHPHVKKVLGHRRAVTAAWHESLAITMR